MAMQRIAVLTSIFAGVTAHVVLPESSESSLMIRNDPPPSKVATITAGSSESPMPCVVNFLPEAPAVIISCSLTTPQVQPHMTAAPNLADRAVQHPPPDPGYEFLHLSANIDVDFVKSRCPSCYNQTAGRPYNHTYGVNVSGTATASDARPTILASMMYASVWSTETPKTSSTVSSSASSRGSFINPSKPSQKTAMSTQTPAASFETSSTISRGFPSKAHSTKSFKPPVPLHSSSSLAALSSTSFASDPSTGSSQPEPTTSESQASDTSSADPAPSSTDSLSAQTIQEASSSSVAQDPSTSESSADSTKTESPAPEATSAETSSEDPAPMSQSSDRNLMTDQMGFTWSVRGPTKSRSVQVTIDGAAPFFPISSQALPTSYQPTYQPNYRPTYQPPPAVSQKPHYVPWECDEMKDPGCTSSKL